MGGTCGTSGAGYGSKPPVSGGNPERSRREQDWPHERRCGPRPTAHPGMAGGGGRPWNRRGCAVRTPSEWNELRCVALVKGFGHINGMLVRRGGGTQWAEARELLDQAVDLGYGYTHLDAEEYDRSSFIGLLNDWGWHGDADVAPDWYTGEPELDDRRLRDSKWSLPSVKVLSVKSVGGDTLVGLLPPPGLTAPLAPASLMRDTQWWSTSTQWCMKRLASPPSAPTSSHVRSWSDRSSAFSSCGRGMPSMPAGDLARSWTRASPPPNDHEHCVLGWETIHESIGDGTGWRSGHDWICLDCFQAVHHGGPPPATRLRVGSLGKCRYRAGAKVPQYIDTSLRIHRLTAGPE